MYRGGAECLRGSLGGILYYLTSGTAFCNNCNQEDERQELTDSAGGEVEGTNAFTPTLGMLQAGWHPKEWGNVVVAYRSFFDMDPYQNLGQDGRITLSRRNVLGEGQASGHSLDGMMQTTMVYGEVSRKGVGNLYYAAGMTADPMDSEGKGGKDVNVRLAYDCLKGGMIGVFASNGKTGLAGPGTPTRYRQSRSGVDMLVEVKGLTLKGASDIIRQKVRRESHNNRGGYVEAFIRSRSRAR